MTKQEYKKYHPKAHYTEPRPIRFLYPIGTAKPKRKQLKKGRVRNLNRQDLIAIDPAFDRSVKPILGRKYLKGGVRQKQRKVVIQAYKGGPTLSRFELQRRGFV